MEYLNLGCGSHFHSHWTNLDFYSSSLDVVAHDLTQGIPFKNESFDVVYHSHVLEHFPKSYAPKFLQECYRVLKPGGLIRVVIPDLEEIIKLYLQCLEQALEKPSLEHSNYEWVMLELLDQIVRNKPGGDVVKFLSQKSLKNWSFIQQRWGKAAVQASHQYSEKIQENPQWLDSIKYFYRLIRYPKYLREFLLRLLLGKEYISLQTGRFRQSGEIHQWMYDRYSLTKLLKDCGFEDVVVCEAHTSSIPDWTSFCLDTDSDGTVLRPDSLFVEARKLAKD